MRIAGVQMDVRIGEVEANLERIEHFLRRTAAEGVELTVFPECALTGYCFASAEEGGRFAQPVPGPATDHLTGVCRELECSCVFGMLEQDDDRLFNAAVLVDPNGVVGAYRKVHLPYLGIDMFTTPGNRPFAVHSVGAARVGMNICYDAAFPEAARCLALLGADLIVLPTNWPPGAECMAACSIATRAMENAVYYAAINRVGTERGFRFIGHSSICAPDGSTLALGSDDEEQILYARVDLECARRKHIIRVADKHEIDRLADRRPEMYDLLTVPHDRLTPRQRHAPPSGGR